jgi:hypothetical protein
VARPGLREDLLFSPQKCTTNRFIDLFRNSAELLWAKDEHEAYVQDFDKGLYAFSAPFLGAYSQLECWRMKRDFLQEFPELRRAIPCSQPSLLGLRLPVITLDSFTEEEAENTNLLW